MDVRRIYGENTEDLVSIHQLAHDIWWPTYQAYLPAEQIQTMLDNMYSLPALNAQVANGHQFALLEADNLPIGFISYRFVENSRVTRIEKIYIAPAFQGKGGGLVLLDFARREALATKSEALELNVNRNNPARHFYEKQGFEVVREENLPYGKFILDDYVMRKPL